MRYLLVGMVCVVVGSLLFGTSDVSTAAKTANHLPEELIVVTADDVELTAAAYGVFDVETGNLLFGENLTERRPIASVTKLFTAASVLESVDPETFVTVTATDVATEGRAGKLAAGQALSVRELLFPLLLESSNDAAAALERQLDSVSYANRTFADGSGLSDRNQASVTELAFMTRTLYRSEPHIFDITTLSQYVGTETGWVNNSPIADLPGYRGGKHGYTPAAKRTVAAVFTSPHLADRELVYVLLGSDDLRSDVEQLHRAVADSVVLR